MKRSIKSLLTLALAALSGWMWAAELVIPYSFDGKTGNTEYAYEYKVVMPNTALTSFTTTVRYAGGDHRVEILSVKLLDGETTYTAVATGTDGNEVVVEGASYSGGNNYHNVYTFTNEAGFTANKEYTLQANLKVTEGTPSHNGNIKVSGGITLDVAPFSFGVNFKTADAQNISTTTGAGFAKGSYEAPINWANYTADGGNHATYTIDTTAIDVSWVARGGYNSGCSTDTDAGKLLHGYLNDVANNARTKATVTISGLPRHKKYAVALLLSGDGNGDANFNNRFSPVWINNEVYAYSGTTLVKGDAAKEIQYWGSRAASAAAAGLVEGTNVMFVEGLSGGAISITSAMDDSDVFRLTIAGIQVWVTDEAAEAPAALEDKEIISLNFQSSQGSVSGEAGLVAAGGWNNLGNNGSESVLNVWTGEKAVSYPMTLTYSSNNGHQWTTATDAFLKGYLDDGGNHAQVSLTGIPFEKYSVIVYAATDTASLKFRSVTINGQAYIGTPGATTLGYALPVYNNTHARYGASRALTATYGTNALRVDGLSGDLTIAGGANEFNARGGIAAIQIINTGTALPDAQVIDWTAQSEEQLKTSVLLSELTNVEVQLKLAEGATLEMDSDITGHTIEVVGNNVKVNVTNLEISQAAAQAIFPGAMVTTAYTETFGIEVDGINHPYFFRGTTDATYNNAANWYIGKRVMGEQTKWLSVSGNIAPGMPNSAMWQHILLDGDMMDTITSGEDGYKTITSTSNLEGWNPRYTVINGAQLVIPGLVKIQNGDGANAEWRVDETSKITFNGTLSTGPRVDFYVKSENGVTASNLTLNGNTNYELDSAGSVVVGALNGTATINGVKLDLGDSNLSGKKVVPRKLIGFTSSNATFATADGAVTTSVDTVTPEAVDILQNVGQYKFEKKADGYYVRYVAYAETDEIGAMNTWTKTVDGNWNTAGNWSSGFVPAASKNATISITADTTITIPAEGVSVDVLTVNGEGTLTIAGGKLTATKILANTSIAADETTLALAEMDIAEGKTVTYAINTNGEQRVPALTGLGTFVKAGTGMLTMDKDSACDASITVNAGTLRFHEYTYSKTYNIVAKDGAKIQVGTWAGSLTSDSNTLKLEGGAMLQLNNGNSATGAIIKGTIVIDSTAEKPAVIKGNNNGDNGVIAATIKGNGVLEIQDADDNIFTISGVIANGDAEGDVLAVKVVTDCGVIFTGVNTYTGGTVIAEGAMVSVSNANTIFGTGNVTGAGTVKIVGGTYNGLSLAQYTDANTTIEIPADNTVTGYFNSATWTCAAKIQLDGALDINDGFSAGKYTFTGPWTGAGAISLSNTPTDLVRITGDISDFTGNISVAGGRAITFCAATTGTNQKYSGKICVHGDYAYTAKVNGTWSAPVVVENGAKIGGEGSIANTLTFNAGAIIDGSVATTGNVELNGTVTVSGEAGATVLTCANAASLDLTKFAALDGLKCVADGTTIKLAVAKKTNFVVTVGEGESATTTNCETVAEALDALAANGGTLTIANDADDAQLTLADTLVITNTVTIDLNGKTITAAAGKNALHVQGGTLTITDSSEEKAGKVIATGAQAVRVGDNVKTVADPKPGTFTLEAGTLEGDYGITVWQNSIVTIEGGTVKGAYAISGNGYNNGTTITINDGTIEGTEVGIYHPQTGTLTIAGGVISGPTGIEMRAGTLTMSDGSVTGTGTYTVKKNGNGSTVSGAAIAISQHGSVPAVTATITGGTITAGEEAKTIAVANTTTDKPVCSLSVAADIIEDANTVAVEVPTLMLEKDTDGALSLGSAVAELNGTKYATLDAALDAAQPDDTITLLDNVEASFAKAVTIDLNGKSLKGTIAATIVMNGGKYYAADDSYMAGPDGYYATTDATFVLGATAIEIAAGNVSITKEMNTMPGQTLTIAAGASFTVPAGETINVLDSTIIVNGTLTIEGTVKLGGTYADTTYTAGTITAAANLAITSGVEGYEVKYAEGKYSLAEKVVVPPAIAENDNIPDETKAAIKEAMQDAGVTEISSYSIITTGSGTDATVDEVAAVLEIFDVEPTVGDNGVLSVAYEFGISNITNNGDGTVDITAGVDDGTEIRAGVAVTFYAGDEEIATDTTAADSTTVSITDIDAATISGEEISVKATK